MNRTKLQRRTELAAKIRDRYNPAYRVWDENRGQYHNALTRAEARNIKRQLTGEGGSGWIEQRQDAELHEAATYVRVR